MKYALGFAMTCILLMLPLSSLLTLSSAWTHLCGGYLGRRLSYRMYSPIILVTGSNTTINFTFFVHAEIFVKHIYISVYGSSISDSPVPFLVESNRSLSMWDSINYSILVEPLVEGSIVVHVKTEYDFYDDHADALFHEFAWEEIILDAKSMTYDELRQRSLLFQYLSYGFGITTFGLILIVAYVYAKRKKEEKARDAVDARAR